MDETTPEKKSEKILDVDGDGKARKTVKDCADEAEEEHDIHEETDDSEEIHGSEEEEDEEDEDEEEEDEEEEDEEIETSRHSFDDDPLLPEDFFSKNEDHADEEEDGDISTNDLDSASDAILTKYWPDESKMPDKSSSAATKAKWWGNHWASKMSMSKDEAERNLVYTLYICTLDEQQSSKTDWTPEDLEKDPMAKLRALSMLGRQRFGVEDPGLYITPYIDYSGLKDAEGNELISKTQIEREKDELERAQVGDSLGSDGKKRSGK